MSLMRTLIAVATASLASACLATSRCEDATTHFFLYNTSGRPAQIFEGYESNTLQIDNAQCVQGIASVTVPNGGRRLTNETRNFCDDDVRVFGVTAGPVGQVCGGVLVTIPAELLKHEIFVSATYRGEGVPDALVVDWSPDGEPHPP